MVLDLMLVYLPTLYVYIGHWFVTPTPPPAPKHLMSEMDPLLEQLIPASYLVLEDIVRSLAEQCKKQARQPIFTKQEFM